LIIFELIDESNIFFSYKNVLFLEINIFLTISIDDKDHKMCIVYLLQCLVAHPYREEILNNCPSKVYNWATFQHYNFQVFKNKNIKNV